MNGFKWLKLILSAAAVFTLAGCSRDASEEDMEITVISDGTTSVISEEASSYDDSFDDVSDTELYIPDHMVTKYMSLGYDRRMQDVYDDVVDILVNFEPKGLIPLTISTDDFRCLMETVRCEQLMLFYLKERTIGDFVLSAQTFEINYSYKYSIKEVNIMLMETEKEANAIVSQTEGMTDYEKVKFFHDHLVQNVESSTDDPYADSVYGALVKKKALCEGYAKAFSYLCNIAGIENMIVTGKTDVDHMWNMVKLEDSWYHVDVGWDKPAAALKKLYPDMILYQYFLATDSVVENNRVISTALGQPPAADNAEMSYFRREKLYAESYDQALSIIEASCAKCIDSGEKYFMIKLDSSNLYLQTAAELIKPDAEGVTDIDRIVNNLNFHGRISYIDYYKNYRILIFVLE